MFVNCAIFSFFYHLCDIVAGIISDNSFNEGLNEMHVLRKRMTKEFPRRKCKWHKRLGPKRFNFLKN